MACWEWVGVGALFTCLESCFCWIFFNSISELSSGKKYSESLRFTEGWDSVPGGFVFFRVSYFPFLWLRPSWCFSPSHPSHSFIASPFLFFILSTSWSLVPPSHFCQSLLTSSYFSFCPLLPWLAPSSLLSVFLPSRISQASHNEEQIGFLTGLVSKEHHVDARLSWYDMILQTGVGNK